METYTVEPVIVRSLFDSETHNTIVRYINEFVPFIPLSTDRKDPDDESAFGRRYGNDLPFFVNIHQQLTEYASDLFGEKVKPSYVFLSMYEKAGRCPLHLDRPQCRYTIDYLIQQEQSEPWPINISKQMSASELEVVNNTAPTDKNEIAHVIGRNTWTTCLLEPNDAVCYSGTNAWHYRPTASDGTADLVFFHFVPEAFDGPLN